MDNNAKDLVARGDAAFSRRSPVDSLRQEIALQFAPALATFTTNAFEGEDLYAHLFDPSGAIMGGEFSDLIGQLLRPDGRRWFRTTVEGVEEPTTEGRRFFDLHSGITRSLMEEPRAKFSRCAKQMDLMLALFGEAPISIEERLDPRDPGLRFRAWHPSTVAFVEDENGDPGTVFRKFDERARMLCRMFERMDGANMHPEAKKVAEESADAKLSIFHAVVPEDEYDYKYRRRPTWNSDEPRFVSLYIDRTNEHVIREKPTRWSSYVIPRWQMVPGLPDGFSPAAMMSLPISRRLQQMYIAILEAAEKSAAPPLIAYDDVITSGEIDLSSDGVTFVDREYDAKTGRPVEPIQIGGDMRVALEAVRDARETMVQAWKLNKLQMPSERPKTAYEASLLFQDFIRSALPIVAPLETECNTPILSRIVDIGTAVGAYDSLFEELGIPEELGGRDLRFEFSNPLRDAMEGEKRSAFEGMLQTAAMASEFDPSARGAMDIRTATRDVLNTFGQSKWVASEREQQIAAEQMEAQMREQAELAAAREAAAAAKDGAQAMQAGSQALGGPQASSALLRRLMEASQ